MSLCQAGRSALIIPDDRRYHEQWSGAIPGQLHFFGIQTRNCYSGVNPRTRLVVVVLIRARIRGTTSPRGVCLDPLLYSDYWAVDSQADVSNFKVGNILHLHHSWKKTDDSISALSKGSSLVLLLYTAIAIAIALVLCACSDILKYTRIVVLKIAGSVFPDYRHSREKGYITSKAEITVYSVSSNPGLNMNSKALAQQISSWYTSHVDSYATHGSNMNRYLRGPVIALTVRIIGSTESGLESEQAHQPHLHWAALLQGQQRLILQQVQLLICL